MDSMPCMWNDSRLLSPIMWLARGPLSVRGTEQDVAHASWVTGAPAVEARLLQTSTLRKEGPL